MADKYLKAIQSSQIKKEQLEDRRDTLKNENQKKIKEIQLVDQKLSLLEQEKANSKQRKFYLSNYHSLLKEYWKKAIKFGLASGVGFIVMILLIEAIGYLFLKSTIMISLSSFIEVFPVIAGMMGLVEFRYVSKDFFRKTAHYHDNIDDELNAIEESLEKEKEKKKFCEATILENEQLLAEIEEVLILLNDDILDYQQKRLQLIEQVVEELDQHITDFVPHELDIHKLLEKKIP